MSKKPKNKQPSKAAVFYPQWADADRRDQAHRLIEFVGKSNMPEWAKRDVSFALADLWAGAARWRTPGHRPPTPYIIELRIARCLVWLEVHHPKLSKKHRKGIVARYLQIKPSATDNVPPTTLDAAKATLSKWLSTLEGQWCAADLSQEARRPASAKASR